jgi:hypothetical protein
MFNIAPSSRLEHTEACSARKASSIAAHFGMLAGPADSRAAQGKDSAAMRSSISFPAESGWK